jgi:hypothetical protein
MTEEGLEIVTGQPYLDWATGPVGFGWATGQPDADWTTGPVTIG